MTAPTDGWYRGSMVLSDCSFSTERLAVNDWFRLLDGEAADAVRDSFVMSLLTERVTRDLPPQWQGQYDMDRAASWFAERQGESTVLLVVKRPSVRPVGLLILSESESSHRSRDIRLGYMIAESAWGSGFASELVAGFVDWCRTDGSIRSVVGGVAAGHSASARVLQKNGFVPHTRSSDHPVDEVEYRLTLAT
jgi:RimJ/RimL family protein N-acetyltransferase